MTSAVSPPPRYTARPLPPYRYVPGESPHPTRDPAGHAYGANNTRLKPFKPREWRNSETYLYGIDLFNHGYWWEAHEALEAVWAAAGRHSRTGQFVQGLILIAAAHLKRLQGDDDTARQMAGDGLEKMQPAQGVFLGVDTASLPRRVQSWCADASQAPVRIELILM